MNVKTMHLKNTLWKPFDDFPSDIDIFKYDVKQMGRSVFCIMMPHLFNFYDVNKRGHDVFRVAYNLVDFDEVADMGYCYGHDNYALAFKALKKEKKIKFLKKNPYNVKDNILKIVESTGMEGYFPEEARWCRYDEFDEVMQEVMF